MAILLRKRQVLCSFLIKSFGKSLHTTDKVASDAIEDFTDALLYKKQLKKEIEYRQNDTESTRKYFSKLKNVRILLDSTKNKTAEKTSAGIGYLSADFETLDQKHIDHLLLTAYHDKNIEFIEKFVDLCIARNKVISENSVLTLCEYFSTIRDNRTLIKLIELCKLNNRTLYDEKCEFNHLIARNLWEKGNSDEALNLLGETYQKASTSLRKSILLLLKFIVDDTVDKKSEAVLVRLIKSAALFQEKFNEPTVLAYVWKVCFLSNWFSDQVVSDQLFSDYSSIRIFAAKRFMRCLLF